MSYIDCTERQIGKGQDMVIYRRNLIDKHGEQFDGLFLADGHGTNQIIDKLREFDKNNMINDIMCEDDPMTELIYRLKNIRNRYNLSSGSTAIFVKIYSNRAVFWSVGDSRVMLCINNKIVYINCPHNTLHALDMERLKGKVILNKSLDPVAVISTKTSLITKDSIYILFNDGTSLAMSQALGHNGITGYAPEKKEIFYESTDKVDIILGSDGFWDQIILDENSIEESADCLSDLNDLFTMTSEQLANKSDARWKQPWKYYWNPKDLTKTLDDIEHEAYDDICVGIWSNVARNASVSVSVEEEVVVEDDYDYSDMPGLISTYDVLRNDICRLEMEIFSLDEQKKHIKDDEIEKIEDIEKKYEDTFQQIIYKIRQQLCILSKSEQISRLNDLQTGIFTHNVIGLNELEIELLLENYYNEGTEKDELEEDASASASACLELGQELGLVSGSN